ncbi:hypothetical protein CDAR_547861 [Caerostris darwini]|uniref:Uncharacterized protein n=1 Tax=Caerostris darwini TaxID=1538125 RepID=A0AAV4WFJ4_9ARAC|nr:hypothetical protein CDAR_547861 [Caerostris darwini]
MIIDAANHPNKSRQTFLTNLSAISSSSTHNHLLAYLSKQASPFPYVNRAMTLTEFRWNNECNKHLTQRLDERIKKCRQIPRSQSLQLIFRAIKITACRGIQTKSRNARPSILHPMLINASDAEQ